MWRMLTALTAAIVILFVRLATSASGSDAVSLAKSIDRQIQSRLEAEGVQRAAPADDAEFLRRAHLDLHGKVPSAERAAQFLGSDDPRKRAKLIDELVGDSRFGEYFGDVWRKRLISPANDQRQQTERFASWLAGRFNENAGWDQIVQDLVTASGKMEENPAVTYLIEGRFPLGVTDLTDLSSRYFLGIRLNCAQCHDHPTVAWKRQDYWGMAAFFAQIQTPNKPKVVYLAGLRDDPKMTLASLRESDAIDGFLSQPPTFLGGSKLEGKSSQPHRVALAKWLTSAENPYFARAAVNRMWWHFFGRGIVSPVDDMHTGNPPSHPELLDELSREFAESGFDLKFLCRAILNSRTYQQTSRPGKQADAEEKLFARMPMKVLTAEQLYDSLVEVLGPPEKSPSINARLGTRYEFCQYFAGDGEADPTRYERGIPHLLRLMNSPQFAGRSITALVTRAQSGGRSQEEVVQELFLTILSRRPTAAEQKLADEQIGKSEESATAYHELAWALLMSSEFSLNH